MIKQNPNTQKKYELRFILSKFHHEIIGSYYQKSLAYGMRKKLINEQPQKYPLNKLTVKEV